ncbi:MAG: hypothetical protein ACM3ML_17745 [Micromonosporaceae bacterium]
MAIPRDRPVLPTFAEYVPVVSAAVTSGTRRAHGSYWNRIIGLWGGRRLDEPTLSEPCAEIPAATAVNPPSRRYWAAAAVASPARAQRDSARAAPVLCCVTSTGCPGAPLTQDIHCWMPLKFKLMPL